MGKRFAIFIVVLLVSGLAVMVYFLHQGRKTILTDPYKAVPSDAFLIIETIDLQSFLNSVTSDNGIMAEVASIKDLDRLNTKIRFLARQVNKTECHKIQSGSSAIISFSFSEEGNTEALLSLAVLSGTKIRHLKEVLLSSGINAIQDNKIFGTKVLELPYATDNREDTVYIALKSGLLICTHSVDLMKTTIARTTIGSDDIRDRPGFSRIFAASGKNEDKIFLVFDNLKPVINSVFREDYVSARGIEKLTEYAVGDIYIKDNGVVVNGYTECTDTSRVLYKYKTGNATAFDTYKILPSATALFESLVPSFRTGDEKADNVSPAVADLASALAEFTGDEVTRAYINIKGSSADENTLIIYELTDRVFAEKIFLDHFSQQEKGTGITYFHPDNQINIPVYKTTFRGLADALIPGFSRNFDDSYFAFYSNYLITGSSDNTIFSVLYDNMLKKTLANDLIYKEFESTLPSVSAYYFYCVPFLITDYLKKYLSDDIISFMESNEESLSKIQATGYQLTPSNNMIYNSLSVLFKEEPRKESLTEWETLLDTIAGIKPFFFTNHNTGEKEIFIQDLKNNAYLINAAGRILWKVPLREKIQSAVYMIDYYRNSKYQLLFSGKNYLHLLDRNGNYVERYPVRLRSPATNPLALFDYDNNQNYRLLIAGEDKMVYAYDKSGSIVKGWRSFSTASVVSSEICWFRISGKDYLITADETSLYFTDRTGRTRLTLKEHVTKARGSSIRLDAGSEPCVICSGPDGIIQHIYFDGSVKKSKKREFSSDHSFDFFDVDGDGFGEYIFIDSGILYLYDNNGSELFNRKFGSDELGGPINFIFSSSDRKIGVFDIKNKQIFLVDSEGNTMSGFPLRGASMFSIGRLTGSNDWNLIVGGTDRFLYNYKLNTRIK
ncbi:MAG TPA: hypothetical protein PLX41_01025 [Bacteroidales bacterium]|nr:hypothetical protein [Bacteroidales bacterium]